MINRHERLGTSPAAQERSSLSVREPLRDDVSESSAESFPASDAPSWSGMRAGPPARLTGSFDAAD